MQIVIRHNKVTTLTETLACAIHSSTTASGEVDDSLDDPPRKNITVFDENLKVLRKMDA